MHYDVTKTPDQPRLPSFSPGASTGAANTTAGTGIGGALATMGKLGQALDLDEQDALASRYPRDTLCSLASLSLQKSRSKRPMSMNHNF